MENEPDIAPVRDEAESGQAGAGGFVQTRSPLAVYARCYREVGAGGFTRTDGTVQFFARVNALLESSMVVLDFGAGRGLGAESGSRFGRNLADLRGKVRRVIGVDVDDAVLQNPTVDERHVFDGAKLPLSDDSVDLVLSDHVFEHVPDPEVTASELYRVVRPGGWICARTPHSFSLLALASRMVPNRAHANALTRVQPGGREAHDVFPTKYKLNTFSALRRYFPAESWEDFSYTWSPEPAYHFGSPLLVRVLRVIQYLKAPFGGEVLLVFLRKR